VRDLASTNGTYVNGARVETARLATGDRLKVGRVELVATQEVD
jgi:pSer/pThr/pTyr-binding forkhead associated (FHA) protein